MFGRWTVFNNTCNEIYRKESEIDSSVTHIAKRVLHQLRQSDCDGRLLGIIIKNQQLYRRLHPIIKISLIESANVFALTFDVFKLLEEEHRKILTDDEIDFILLYSAYSRGKICTDNEIEKFISTKQVDSDCDEIALRSWWMFDLYYDRKVRESFYVSLYPEMFDAVKQIIKFYNSHKKALLDL